MTTEQTAQQLELAAQPFQLPPPPPGMQWHRTDGWQEGDLPQGWRPYVQGETLQKCDEWKQHFAKKWQIVDPEDTGIGREPDTSHPFRTIRPLTFTHAGKTWTYHRPGDPMPCDGKARVHVLFFDDLADDPPVSAKEVEWDWAGVSDVIGWRYADEKKTVPLEPEDVLPGSVIQGVSSPSWHWISVVSVHQIQVKLAGHCGDIGTDRPTWEELKLAAKINRSIPLTGKWNPDAWEPCHKILTKNG